MKCFGLNTNGVLGPGDTGTRGDNTNGMGDSLPYTDLGMVCVHACMCVLHVYSDAVSGWRNKISVSVSVLQ